MHYKLRPDNIRSFKSKYPKESRELHLTKDTSIQKTGRYQLILKHLYEEFRAKNRG